MKVLGCSSRNKWCCFCTHWFNPGEVGLTPRKGSRDLFDVDKDHRCTCREHGYVTPACSTCPKYEKKY